MIYRWCVAGSSFLTITLPMKTINKTGRWLRSERLPTAARHGSSQLALGRQLPTGDTSPSLPCVTASDYSRAADLMMIRRLFSVNTMRGTSMTGSTSSLSFSSPLILREPFSSAQRRERHQQSQSQTIPLPATFANLTKPVQQEQLAMHNPEGVTY